MGVQTKKFLYIKTIVFTFREFKNSKFKQNSFLATFKQRSSFKMMQLSKVTLAVILGAVAVSACRSCLELEGDCYKKSKRNHGAQCCTTSVFVSDDGQDRYIVVDVREHTDGNTYCQNHMPSAKSPRADYCDRHGISTVTGKTLVRRLAANERS